MKVEQVGEKLTVTIPDDVVEALGLHEGDTVSLVRDMAVEDDVPDAMVKLRALAVLRSLARPLPADFRFDREEANAR
ncbi:MAG: AbrB/MazE/SpoVT family DNA-binding domain-containing protein [Sphingomonas paucimobilis]